MKIEIVAEREILQPIEINQGPRITKTQDVRVTLEDGAVYLDRHCYWTEAGKIVRITTSPLRHPASITMEEAR